MILREVGQPAFGVSLLDDEVRQSLYLSQVVLFAASRSGSIHEASLLSPVIRVAWLRQRQFLLVLKWELDG